MQDDAEGGAVRGCGAPWTFLQALAKAEIPRGRAVPWGGGLMSCFTVSAWWQNDFLQYFSFSLRAYTALFLSSKSKIL